MGKSGQCLYKHPVPTTWQVSTNAKCLTNERTRLIRERNYVLPRQWWLQWLVSHSQSVGKGQTLNICTSAPFPRHGNHAQVRNVCIYNITDVGTRIFIYVHSLASQHYLSGLRFCQQMAHEPNKPSTPASHHTTPLQSTLFIRARISMVEELGCWKQNPAILFTLLYVLRNTVPLR